jgi:predicted nucleic acid-binding protein
MACLDTSLLIDLIRSGVSARRRRATDKLRQMLARGEHLSTSRFNVAELLVGVYRSEDPGRELQSVDALLQNITVLEFTPEAARLFGRITALLQQQGRPAGDMDAFFGLASQRLVGDGEGGELVAEELFVDRTGEGNGVDRQASDLLRLRFLEVAGELN